MLFNVVPSNGSNDYNGPHVDLEKAREIALVSLIAPVLFMASLVSSAILMMKGATGSWLFEFWLTGHIFLCAALFLYSTRERKELFAGDRVAATLIKRFPFVALTVCWGVVPGILAIIEPYDSHLVFGAILSGGMLAAAVLLQYMPQMGRLLIAATVGGFLANTLMQPELTSALISMVMLAYFSGLAICTQGEVSCAGAAPSPAARICRARRSSVWCSCRASPTLSAKRRWRATASF